MANFETYNRGIITPGEFMRPPTEGLQPYLSWIALRLEGDINDLAMVRAQENGTPFSPVLRIGSELEVSYFSPDIDPNKAVFMNRMKNPNYSFGHKTHLNQFQNELHSPRQDGGIDHILFCKNQEIGGVSRELHLPPGNVTEYLQRIDVIKKFVQKSGEKYALNPSLISQHFHMSIFDYKTGKNLFGDAAITDASTKGLTDIYRRTVPLLRPPEYVDTDNNYFISRFGGFGIKMKGRMDEYNPYRIEGRFNNFGFAFDPTLNLVINLLGLKKGLLNVHTPEKIDEDKPLEYSDKPEKSGFALGKYQVKFDELLKEFKEDASLDADLNPQLRNVLFEIFSMYPDVSAGWLSSKEARSNADKIISKSVGPMGIVFEKAA